MKDVARAVETSPATVSKVLNGRADQEAISEACRERVTAACCVLDRMGARALDTLADPGRDSVAPVAESWRKAI